MYPILKSLQHRKAIVESRIEEEQARPAPDHLKLSALKRLKLKFRDQIEFIERMDRFGKAIVVPVIRRKSFRSLIAART
jgi:hypothetical protein